MAKKKNTKVLSAISALRQSLTAKDSCTQIRSNSLVHLEWHKRDALAMERSRLKKAELGSKDPFCVVLSLLGNEILVFGQVLDGKPDNVKQIEPELILQALNEMKI
jgi:hypothetical protein